MLICIFSFWGSVPGVSAEPIGRVENCVLTVPVPTRPDWHNLVGWLDDECPKAFQWICEKSISQLPLT